MQIGSIALTRKLVIMGGASKLLLVILVCLRKGPYSYAKYYAKNMEIDRLK